MGKNSKIFSLIGPPASGKGVLATMLAEHYISMSMSVLHIDTGAQYRHSFSHNEKGITLSEKSQGVLRHINDAGKLQPSAASTTMWMSKFLREFDNQDIFIFDGSPRRKNEYNDFNQFVDEFFGLWTQVDLIYVIIAVDEGISLERSIKRNELEQRTDSTSIELIEDRIEMFKKETVPMIEQIMLHYKYVQLKNNASIEEFVDAARQELIFADGAAY